MVKKRETKKKNGNIKKRETEKKNGNIKKKHSKIVKQRNTKKKNGKEMKKRNKKKTKRKGKDDDDWTTLDISPEHSFEEINKKQIIDENYTPVHVLWVRHCLSYANDTDMNDILEIAKKKVFTQPLCTKGTHDKYKNYLSQPYDYHKYLLPFIHGELDDMPNYEKLKDNEKLGIYREKTFDKIKLYSSILPRAMQTSKLIGMGLVEKGFDVDVVHPLNYCSELENIIEKSVKNFIPLSGTQNSSNLNAHETYVEFLNYLLPSNPSILKLDSLSEEMNLSKYDFYDKWKMTYLPKFAKEPEKLHVIVAHGTYISENILGVKNKGSNKMHNLDAALVKYNVPKNPKDIDQEIIAKRLISDVEAQRLNKDNADEEMKQFIKKITNTSSDEEYEGHADHFENVFLKNNFFL